ncbi:hypothetical protein [Deinococcus fonticola]|uniref:hypothetical protein n=1 Tax=Deinococcus fonticola TaxID=2528713 RepID=UPI0010754C5A|nr:hypothetical protein [Deinococcus fonticola]
MRFQTMYVDMRPVLAKWLGILTFILFLFLMYLSIKPDFDRAAAQAAAIYSEQNKAAAHGNGLEFLKNCLFGGKCINKINLNWTAPLPVKAFLIGGTFFGMLSAAFGMWWRPEVMANRDIRVNSAKIDQSRETSPTLPKGLL